jgi:hypothetical protein
MEVYVSALQRLSLALAILFSLNVLASDGREEGGVSGGGGNAFVCRKDGEIVSVELVDLYEAREGRPSRYLNLNPEQGMDLNFNIILEKLGRGSLNPKFIQELNNEYINLKNNLIDLPEDAELYPTNDVMLTFKPKGCTLEPVINYFSRKRIIIDRNLYNKMDFTNQIALMLHEVLYLKEREQGVRDSRYVRQIVGETMRDSLMHTGHLNLNAPVVQRCETMTQKRKSVFYITPRRTYYMSENKPVNTIFFEKLNGHNLITYTGFDIDLSEITRQNSFEIFNPTLMMDEDIKTNIEIDLISVAGELNLSFRGESNDWFDQMDVICQSYNLNR